MNKASFEFAQEPLEKGEAQTRGATFGALLRYARRQSKDPLRGGLLTQERLGELIGEVLGDAGYTGAAVSEWERDKSKIHAGDREVLLALVAALGRCGGLADTNAADALLAAGNYRRLNEAERLRVLDDRGGVVGRSGDRGITGGAAAFLAENLPAKRRNQLILLEKVHGFWVEGVLAESVRGVPLLQLPRTYHTEAIDHPWDGALGQWLVDSRLLASTSLPEAYRRADQALLILGAPGAGKTTTLLMLAGRLIEEARRSPAAQLPVVLDLSSWGRQRLPLADWIVEELAAKYQIPRRYGRKWLTANELALLLDGLDALSLDARAGCIEAINTFRETHGLSGLVVCSRTDEYLAVGRPLRVGGAVSLQNLSAEQVARFVAEGGPALAPLAGVLASGPELSDLAQTPLMLNVMAATVAGGEEAWITAVEQARRADLRHGVLFDAYVRRMFARRAPHPDYSQEQTLRWLRWLASNMSRQNQSLFMIEALQPSWLPDRRARLHYLLLAGLITGLAGGVIMWLLWRVLRLALPQLPAPTSAWVAGLLGMGVVTTEPLTILLGNLFLGLLLGAILYLILERRTTVPGDRPGIRRLRRVQMLLVGGVCGAITFLFINFFAGALLSLAWAVAEGFMFGSAARYLFGWSYATEVRPVESLGWSWRHAAVGAGVGLAMAAVAELIEAALYGYNGAARTVATLLLAGFILGGLRGRTTEVKSAPNQGVWLSLRNALIAAPVLALPLAILTSLIRSPRYALNVAVLAALISASLMGVGVFFKHFLLRYMFYRAGHLPWRYARFLDYAAQLALLRKVGGGYIFMHGLLQEHLAGPGLRAS